MKHLKKLNELESFDDRLKRHGLGQLKSEKEKYDNLKEFFNVNKEEINHICDDLRGIFPDMRVIFSMTGYIEVTDSQPNVDIPLLELSEILDEMMNRMNDLGLEVYNEHLDFSKGNESYISFDYLFTLKK